MQLNRRGLLLGGLAVMALAGCAAPRTERLAGTAAHQQLPLTTPSVPDLVAVSRDLAWQLMQLEDHAGNTVVSPASLVSALALIRLGASGSTAESLDRVFGMGAQEGAAATNALRTAMSGYDSLPEKVDAKHPPERPVLHQESHLLIIDDAAVRPAFLDDAARYFSSTMERTERGSAKAALDAWVTKHSAGLIKESAVTVRPDSLLVLQDAILFAAAWRTRFDREEPLLFRRPGGQSVTVDGIMHTFRCPHVDQDGWQAIRLPYTEAFAVDIILPPERISPHEADATRLARIRELLDSAAQREVMVHLPTLDTRSTLDLSALLARHGVEFKEVDGIFPEAVVGEATQQARLQITAQGTVGAAVTEIMVVEVAAPGTEGALPFVVDRPYLMDIAFEATGWSLFLAAISDPTLQ
ncbi:MAG: serpin family protein [Propionibacteriaceae bacterium]|nr:serpin family protein [Propionibacteriaceae bacterium]